MATMIATGSYTGNGSAKDIEVGFIPDYVRLVDVTGAAVDEWFVGMAAATSYTNATDAASGAVRASPNGVTAFAGDSTTGQGFSVGAGLSTNAHTYRWVAVSNGHGF